MIIPVRCFTCGKLVGDQWDEFTRRIKTGENASDILDSLGIKRYCCRRMLLSNV
ncbi:MAG: DNA-directed RNA polymerase subunit N, partial [Candidatus Bathyarchaeia archaeon]